MYKSVQIVLLVLLLLFAVWFMCHAASPLDPPKPYHTSRTVTQGSGASALLVKTFIPPPPVTNKWLVWDYAPASNIVFNVRSLKTNALARPSTNWAIVATVATNRYLVTFDKSANMVWLGVTASNTYTTVESDFSQ